MLFAYDILHTSTFNSLELLFNEFLIKLPTHIISTKYKFEIKYRKRCIISEIKSIKPSLIIIIIFKLDPHAVNDRNNVESFQRQTDEEMQYLNKCRPTLSMNAIM